MLLKPIHESQRIEDLGEEMIARMLQRKHVLIVIGTCFTLILAAGLCSLVQFSSAQRYLHLSGFAVSCEACSRIHPFLCQRRAVLDRHAKTLDLDADRFCSSLSTLGVVHLELGSVEGVTVNERLVERLIRVPLVELSVAGTDVGDRHMTYISKISTLKTLILGAKYGPHSQDRNRYCLRESLVSDDGLCILSTHTGIESLNLRSLPVTDRGMRHLAGMPLRRLIVDGCGITDESVEFIATIRTLDELTLSEQIPSLSVSLCDPRQYTHTGITLSGKKRLAELRPDITIAFPDAAMREAVELPAATLSVRVTEVSADGRDNKAPIGLLILFRRLKWIKVYGALAHEHDTAGWRVTLADKEWRVFRFNESLLVLMCGECFWAARLHKDEIERLTKLSSRTTSSGG